MRILSFRTLIYPICMNSQAHNTSLVQRTLDYIQSAGVEALQHELRVDNVRIVGKLRRLGFRPIWSSCNLTRNFL